MTQKRMDFAEKELEKARRKRIATLRRNAIAEFGTADEFAESLGVHETAISQALGGNVDRHWREDWTTALLASPKVTAATKRALANVLLGDAGLVAAPQEEVSVLTVAERAITTLEQFGKRAEDDADELRGLLLGAVAAGRFR